MWCRAPFTTNAESNESLCRDLEVSPQWIVEKTGIRQRFVAGRKTPLLIMRQKLTKHAMDMAGVCPSEVDLIIACTFLGLFAPVSAKVQMNLKASNAQIFDVQQIALGSLPALPSIRSYES